MAFALAKENEEFISRMIRQGRFNNQSEVVREALRRMEKEETSYLNPVPLTMEEVRAIYRSNPHDEQKEKTMAKKSRESIGRSIKASKLKLENL